MLCSIDRLQLSWSSVQLTLKTRCAMRDAIAACGTANRGAPACSFNTTAAL